LNTQKKAAWRTHNIKKHTTHEKEKRETFPQKKAPTQNTKSLSLSLHFVPPSLLVCLAFYPKIWTRMDAWQPKNEKFRSSFPHSAFSSAASPDTERTPACAYSREKEHFLLLKRTRTLPQKHISIIVKIMFAARMMRSAAPTTTTHNQNKTHNFHPKRTAFKGIRRRRCRLPLIAMSIPQQGGNAQPRKSYCCFLSFSLSRLLVFLVFAQYYRDVLSTPP
jgi:hypothetical protein